MLAIGVDAGSTSTKAVAFDGHDIVAASILPTGWSPRQAGGEAVQRVLAACGLTDGVGPTLEREECRASGVRIVGTGYGRVALPFLERAVTEITCHARGARHLCPEARLVIDIGGQDSKVIHLDSTGRVRSFAMNDKCAAGTGRFLQTMAITLGVDVSELGPLSEQGQPLPISSMCTVFAESEVVSLLACGESKQDVAAGLHRSVARRVAAMIKGEAVEGAVVFTGGVAYNTGMRRALAAELCREIGEVPDPQLVGALGAALLAWTLDSASPGGYDGTNSASS